MWVVRELLRLLVRIGVAVAIAVAIAGVKVAIAGGDLTHTFKVTLFVLAALMLLLAGAGAKGSAGTRRVNQRFDLRSNFVMRIPGVPATTEGPTLTASAVFCRQRSRPARARDRRLTPRAARVNRLGSTDEFSVVRQSFPSSGSE